jgi:hyaluronan synthase
MIYFLLLLLSTIMTGSVYAFELFVIYAWLIWIAKWGASLLYKPMAGDHRPTVSAIVPVLREDPAVFEDCLRSIKRQGPDEFFVVYDNDEDDPMIEGIAVKYATILRADEKGKRSAVVKGIQASGSDIIVLVDSDTIFEPGALWELVKPFKDAKIGGVTSKQGIFNPDGNAVRKIAAWMEDIRFTVGSIPSQSIFQSVGCLPGRAIAVRRTAIFPHLDEFLHETFLGSRCVIGDDREITNLLLENGWNTVYQSTAMVYTDCPNVLSGLVKQQIRWARSSQRETLRSLKWLWKRPFTLFQYTTDMLTPVLFAVLTIFTLYNLFTGNGSIHIPLWASLPLAIIGMSMTVGLKQYPHLLMNPRDIFFLPVYAIFLMLVLTPIRIYGLFTMKDNGWMTRT